MYRSCRLTRCRHAAQAAVLSGCTRGQHGLHGDAARDVLRRAGVVRHLCLLPLANGVYHNATSPRLLPRFRPPSSWALLDACRPRDGALSDERCVAICSAYRVDLKRKPGFTNIAAVYPDFNMKWFMGWCAPHAQPSQRSPPLVFSHAPTPTPETPPVVVLRAGSTR